MARALFFVLYALAWLLYLPVRTWRRHAGPKPTRATGPSLADFTPPPPPAPKLPIDQDGPFGVAPVEVTIVRPGSVAASHLHRFQVTHREEGLIVIDCRCGARRELREAAPR